MVVRRCLKYVPACCLGPLLILGASVIIEEHLRIPYELRGVAPCLIKAGEPCKGLHLSGITAEKTEDYLLGLVELVLRKKLVENAAVFGERVLVKPEPLVVFGELEPYARVLRVNVRHLFQKLDDVVGLALLLEDAHYVGVFAYGVNDEPLLGVKFGKPVVDIEVGVVELQDLFEHGNGLQVEAPLGVSLCGLHVLLYGLGLVAELDKKVPEPQADGDVLGVELYGGPVLGSRLVKVALGDILLGPV